MKYLSPYSGKDDPEIWLESYYAAGKSEKWSDDQILECIRLKLKKKAKEWYNNLSTKEKPTTWEQLVTLFLEEFGDEDVQTSLARCYKITQRKEEPLKKYFHRYQKYLKKHDSAVKREIAIKYAKYTTQSKSGTDIKSREQFISEESEKLSMHEHIRVETFISGLRHYRSHFLITNPSTMEEVKRIVQTITKKKQWNRSFTYNHSNTDSESSILSESEYDDDNSDNEDKLKSFIKINSQKRSKVTKSDNKVNENHKKSTKDNDFDNFIKQFSEMKIMLAETANKLEKLEQTNKGNKMPYNCKNCQSTTHDARSCSQPCKICKGNQGIHPFYKCPEYRPLKPQGPQTLQETSKPNEHVLLEDDSFERDYLLEDLFVNEGSHRRKRVRIEDIEDEDEVRFVNEPIEPIQPSQATEESPRPEIQKNKPRAKARPKPVPKEQTAPNKAAKQLMDEGKISLTLEQICELAPGFRAELRRMLVKPRKPRNKPTELSETQVENVLISTSVDDQNGSCPRTIVTLNNKFQVNTLLDGGAVPNIISLELVKRLGIKDLVQTHCKYITANGQKSEALGIAQDINLVIQGQHLKFAAIVYNHHAFPLLLGRRVLKRLKVITNWETCTWSIKTKSGIRNLPINFDTDFRIQPLDDSKMEEESNSELEEYSNTTESEEDESDNLEVFMMISNELKENSDNELEIIEATPEIPPVPRFNISEKEKIKSALEATIAKVPSKFQSYIPELRKLCMEYIDIFGVDHNNLKQTDVIEFDIDTGDAIPIYIKSRPLPYKYKEFVKAELDAAVKAGIMSGPLKQLCKWGFPVWVVPKPKTNELRMVGDFRLLNKKTVPDECAIPDTVETMEQLSDAVVFSPLDFLKAFHQIINSIRARERLILATEFGNYRYNVMPFGPTGAPATFSKAMLIAFVNEMYKILAIYFDDATVYSQTVEQHISHLRQVFETVRKHNFTLKPEKCLFFQEEIELLGHMVSPSGIKPTSKLLQKIDLFDEPKSKTDIKAFVHLCGYYQSNIQAFAEIAAPLTEILKKKNKFEMKEKQINAWNLLKEQTLKAIELAFYKPTLENKIYTDASNVGIGAVYTQVNQDGIERPVKFLSRKLTEVEQRYDTVSKELLAIVYTLQKLRKYLLGRPFTLYTDSNAVKWLFTKRDISAKHGRYIMLLQDFPCKVKHIKGKSNVVADILSRYPLPLTNIEFENLDYFDHIMMIENEDLGWEPIFNYLFIYISTSSFEGIPDEEQKGVHNLRRNYFIEKQNLYKRSTYGPLLVPKIQNRPKIIEELHDGHGHFASEATYKRARSLYYWPNMYQDLKTTIKSCIICQACDKKGGEPISSSWPIHVNKLFQRFGLDYVVSGMESHNKNNFIIVATEYYTRWPIAKAVQNADGMTTAKFLYEEIFCTFGPPVEILTDRGSHFKNGMIKHFCELVNVNHKFSTPYHPQTNGVVENLNGTLVNILRKLTIKYPKSWDTYIPTALYAYRTKIHETLKTTPYDLLFGVHPRNMDPIHFSAQVLGHERFIALDEERGNLELKLAKERAKKWSPEINYSKGDIVLVKRMSGLKILSPWFETPYIIYRVHENNTYDLIDQNGELFKSRVNVERLKRFQT
jgi:RNase H-like domain found in reverse transcriptase/Reverse transcriptase (RNA-dependent DNA polymerase)/Integrase zinc binding domain/Integrase core domain/gag-polyprotein putative aspartyl protease/Retrotransposon gag protein